MDPDAVNFGDLNWLAIGLSFVAMMVLGAVWYNPKTPTGRIWMRHLGLDPANVSPPQGGQMARSILLMAVGSFFMMFVFAHTNMIYQDAFRNTATGGTAGFELRLSDTLIGAAFTWLGFIVPMNLNAVAFENKPWRMFFVDTGFYLVGLLVAGVLLAVI